MKKAQTELDDVHYSESNATHDFAKLKQSIENQWTQDSLAVEQVKSENTHVAADLAAEKADLVEAEKRLAL